MSQSQTDNEVSVSRGIQVEMTVQKAERIIVEKTLEFANLNLAQVESDEQVQAIFHKMPFKWAKHHQWLQAQSGLAGGPRDSRGRISSLSLQSQVRKWLEGIIRGDTRYVAASLNTALHRMRITPSIDIQSFTLTSDFSDLASHADEICALGVALLFEWRLLHRLRQCPIDGCGRFRVTFKGKPWNYCSIAHQREGERLRVKRARALGRKTKNEER